MTIELLAEILSTGSINYLPTTSNNCYFFIPYTTFFTSIYGLCGCMSKGFGIDPGFIMTIDAESDSVLVGPSVRLLVELKFGTFTCFGPRTNTIENFSDWTTRRSFDYFPYNGFI